DLGRGREADHQDAGCERLEPHFFSVFWTGVCFLAALTVGSIAVSAAGPMAKAAWLVVMPSSAIASALEFSLVSTSTSRSTIASPNESLFLSRSKSWNVICHDTV